MEEAIVSAVTHGTSEAKVTVGGVPDRPGVAARLFRALADIDQPRHDRPKYVRPGTTDIVHGARPSQTCI